MLEHFNTMLSFFEAHYNDITVAVVAMVSAIIVLIGLLKPLVFNKIENKELRKVALAFSNIALCFVASLVLFLVNQWNMDYYFTSAMALSVSCIITYWFYENTCLRNLINTVGKIALRKVAGVALLAITADDIMEVKKAVEDATKEVKVQTKVEVKKVTDKIHKDKDLENLR